MKPKGAKPKDGKSDVVDGVEIRKQGSKSGRNNNRSLDSESFDKHYNKELKVSEDEIPMVLIELCDTAT